VLRSIFENTSRWSLSFLPLRPSESHPTPGDVPARTVVRQLVRSFLFGLVFLALVGVPSFLLDPLIYDRRYFGYAFAVFFSFGAIIVPRWRRRDRTGF